MSGLKSLSGPFGYLLGLGGGENYSRRYLNLSGVNTLNDYPVSANPITETGFQWTLHYIAEHEELIQELIESIAEYFKQVETGELSAANAVHVVNAFVRMRM